MKITGVKFDNRRRMFEVATRRGAFTFPYGKCQPPIVAGDRVLDAAPDPELGREAFTYELTSGAEGSVPMDGVLDYNADPAYLADLALYELTCRARDRFEESGIGVREAARRLGTSPPQLYRLLDPANRSKNAHQLFALMALTGVGLGVKDGQQRGTADWVIDVVPMATVKRRAPKKATPSRASKAMKKSTGKSGADKASAKKAATRLVS